MRALPTPYLRQSVAGTEAATARVHAFRAVETKTGAVGRPSSGFGRCGTYLAASAMLRAAAATPERDAM